VTAPIKIKVPAPDEPPQAPILDSFSDERRAGTVVGRPGPNGVVRLGCDVERCIAIDHGALRFQPLVTPGWGRQGVAYGPFQRARGLTLAVSITNGHNTSQGSSIQEHLLRRIHRWVVGPNADPWPARLVALALGPRRKGTLRRFRWWLRSTRKSYKAGNLNENLAIGWFTSTAPRDPCADGCGFVIHAAEGENGELWTRLGDRCLSAFRRLKNLQIYYLVALRERGAIYYAAATDGAHGLAGFPMMRPIAVDPFNSDETLYAGIHQCVLGQIGFRVDTRVHGVQIEQLPELASRFGTAHASDPLVGGAGSAVHSSLDAAWRVLRGQIDRTSTGAGSSGRDDTLAILTPATPSGLVHCLIETAGNAGAAGIAWRVRDNLNLWLLKASTENCSLVRVENGEEIVVAIDTQRQLKPNATHSLQILDGHGQFGCYLSGERLFDAWFDDPFLAEATGAGIWLAGPGESRIRDFEAHPREVPMPVALRLAAPWQRAGERVELLDDFVGSAGELAGRSPTHGTGRWEKTFGSGSIDVDGRGTARVRATREHPHPNRTFHTLPWRRPDFAELETTITPPGTGRGQQQCCRAGLVFWQDTGNYLSVSTWLDDAYNGASISVFPKRLGFEELYDAVWTNVGDQVPWGKPFRLRVALDSDRFVVLIDNEPVMQRALTDLYPDDPPLRIARVGLAVNWEWGNDTGSTLKNFTARA